VFGRDTVAIVLTRLGESSLDTVALVPGGEYVYSGGSAGSGVAAPAGGRGVGWMRSGVVFGYYPYFGMRGDQVVVATGDRSGFEVFAVPAAGERPTRRPLHITRSVTSPPVLVRSIAGRYVDWIAEESRGSDRADVAQQVANARARIDAIPPGHHIPYIDDMIVDAVGRVWQRERTLPWQDDGRPRTWIVYATNGQSLARVRVPASFRPIQIEQDFVTGVRRDESDVPFVAIYRIER
jgi:hypothetical protein